MKDKPAVMLSEFAPIIEVYISDDPPFVCGFLGNYVLAGEGVCEAILEDDPCVYDDSQRGFNRGHGAYLLKAFWNEPETDQYGRVENAGYWEYEVCGFKPSPVGDEPDPHQRQLLSEAFDRVELAGQLDALSTLQLTVGNRLLTSATTEAMKREGLTLTLMSEIVAKWSAAIRDGKEKTL